MAGEDGEVHVERVHVDRQVWHGLAGVQHDQCPDFPGQRHEFGDRVEDSGDVRALGEGEESRVLADDIRCGQQIEAAVIVYGNETQGGAGAQRELLPGYEVGVVFHLGDHDLVAGTEAEPAGRRAAQPERGVGETVGQKVDGLGGVGGPDDLVGLRADERGHFFAGGFEYLGRFDGERMGAAVHGSVALLVVFLLGLQHADRVLRGCARVKIGERMPVHQLVQHREVVANTLNVDVGQRGRLRVLRAGRGGRGRSSCGRWCKRRHDSRIFPRPETRGRRAEYDEAVENPAGACEA